MSPKQFFYHWVILPLACLVIYSVYPFWGYFAFIILAIIEYRYYKKHQRGHDLH